MGAPTGETNEFGKQANSKLDSVTVERLSRAFSIGADVTAACYYADISRGVFYIWLKENKELKEKFDRLRQKPVMKAYETIANNMSSVETAKWYLERKRKDEFSTKSEVAHELEDSVISKRARELAEKFLEPDEDEEDGSATEDKELVEGPAAG